MAVYCTRCGAGLPGGARFCSNCGTAVFAAHGPTPLLRPRAGRQIAGVCLGMAQSYGWDVTAVRIVAVLGLIFSSGLVGVAYLAAWIGIPEEPPAAQQAYPPEI